MEWYEYVIAGAAALGLLMLFYYGLFGVRAHIGGEEVSVEVVVRAQGDAPELERTLHAAAELAARCGADVRLVDCGLDADAHRRAEVCALREGVPLDKSGYTGGEDGRL